ncbi:MAG: methylmalonyl-CoA mutase, partial [Candidatus Thorarchaeota archaeon]|nr:methylmalonyl-CoA mutase [Candidatus Thorarchaeota archaeon]
VVVGLNRFTVEEEQQFDYLRVDPAAEAEQIGRLQEMREERDQAAVEKTLEALRSSAENDSNLMPLILDAVKAYVTLGEMCGVLREVFGEYRAPDIL